MGEENRCAICGAQLDEGHSSIEGLPVCAGHSGEIGSTVWRSIGYYRKHVYVERKKALLEEAGLKCLLLTERDPPGFRLIVPEGDVHSALDAISVLRGEMIRCPECRSNFPADDVFCPQCGRKNEE